MGGRTSLSFVTLATPESGGPSTVKNYYLGGFAAAARLRRGFGWATILLVTTGAIYAAIQAL